MKAYSAVLYDLDGTLLDTLDDIANAVNDTLRTLGYPERTRDEIRLFTGNGMERLIRLSLPEGTDDMVVLSVLKKFQANYAEHACDQTKPYAGIPELLKRLMDAGIKQAIVSNKGDPYVRQLNERFFNLPFATGKRDHLPGKPDSALVKLAMDALHADPASTLYVGDSEVDVVTARNADLDLVCVDWGFRDRATLVEAGSKAIVSTCEDLEKAIKGK